MDPMLQAPTNSQSVNPYSYVMNNPLSLVDPSGYESISSALEETISESDGGPNSGADFGDNPKVNPKPKPKPKPRKTNCGSDGYQKCVPTTRTRTGTHIDDYTPAYCTTCTRIVVMNSGNGVADKQQGTGTIAPDSQSGNEGASSTQNTGTSKQQQQSGCGTEGVCLGRIEVEAPHVFNQERAAVGLDFGFGLVAYTRAGAVWLGKRNWTFYGADHGANGGTGAKLRLGPIAEDLSRGLYLGESIYAGIGYYQDMKSGDYDGALDKSTDVLIGGVAAETGPPGWVGGTVYFGVKDTVGWSAASQSYGQFAQQNEALSYYGGAIY